MQYMCDRSVNVEGKSLVEMHTAVICVTFKEEGEGGGLEGMMREKEEEGTEGMITKKKEKEEGTEGMIGEKTEKGDDEGGEEERGRWGED